MRPTIEEEEEVLHTYTVSVQTQVCHRVMVQCCAHRPSKNKTRFRPRGPLDLLGALACGVVSLYARAVAWGGDAADEVLFHSPIGQSSCALAPVWILQFLLSRTYIVFQTRHQYTENLNSEMPGDSRNTFLNWGGILALSGLASLA